jgi:hypothetical protein
MTANISPRSQQVIEARAVAKNATEFARMLNICNKTVWKYYARYNIEPFPHGGHQKHPRADEVCALFNAGKALSEIASELHLTRGSVAGIIHRAGLFQKRAPRKPKEQKAKPTRHHGLVMPKFKAQPFRERIPEVPFLGLSIYQLSAETCRNPDPKCDDPRAMTYCGQPVYGSLPYCAACAAINYMPPQARNRAPRPRA